MRIESVDDYVWEHYESWPGNYYESWPGNYKFKVFIENQFPLLDVFHRSWMQVYDHAHEKAEEHGKLYRKLMRFRDSLDPQLQPCVDPFLTQQDKLRVAYRTICIYILKHEPSCGPADTQFVWRESGARSCDSSNKGSH